MRRKMVHICQEKKNIEAESPVYYIGKGYRELLIFPPQCWSYRHALHIQFSGAGSLVCRKQALYQPSYRAKRLLVNPRDFVFRCKNVLLTHHIQMMKEYLSTQVEIQRLGQREG